MSLTRAGGTVASILLAAFPPEPGGDWGLEGKVLAAARSRGTVVQGLAGRLRTGRVEETASAARARSRVAAAWG